MYNGKQCLLNLNIKVNCYLHARQLYCYDHLFIVLLVYWELCGSYC